MKDVRLKTILIHLGISAVISFIYLVLVRDNSDMQMGLFIFRDMFFLVISIGAYIALSVYFLRWESSQDVFMGALFVVVFNLVVGILSLFFTGWLGESFITTLFTNVFKYFNAGFMVVFLHLSPLNWVMTLIISLVPGVLLLSSTSLDDWFINHL